MSSYISFDVAGKKRGQVVPILRHAHRLPGMKHKNKNIDDERTADNVYLIDRIEPKGSLDRIDKIVNAEREKHGVTKGVRKDANLLTTITITPSGDIMEKHPERLGEFFQHANDFLQNKYGGIPISSVIHYDETTPHLHYAFLPLKDGVLKQASIIGGRDKLRKTHVELREYVGTKMGLTFEKKDDAIKGLTMEEYQAFKDKEKALNEREKALNNREKALNLKENTLNAREKMLNANAKRVKDTSKLNELRASELDERQKRLTSKEKVQRFKETSYNAKNERLTAGIENNVNLQRQLLEFEERLKEREEQMKEKMNAYASDIEKLHEKETELTEREKEIVSKLADAETLHGLCVEQYGVLSDLVARGKIPTMNNGDVRESFERFKADVTAFGNLDLDLDFDFEKLDLSLDDDADTLQR